MSLEISFSDTVFSNKERNPEEFKEISLEIRKDIIKSLYLAGSGHSGGSLGMADIFSVLYFGGVMRYDPNNWQWEKRDRFVLSAGHIAPVLYATLARAGFFPTSELSTLRKLGSRLQGHPGLDANLPGIETSAGSLGQGISIAVGMALSHKLIDKTDQLVFSVTGDGELEEGSVWEAAMAASNFKLNNLCWIVDNNDCQIDGRVHEVMNIYPLEDKFKAFNFNVLKIDGHNYQQIINAFKQFKENAINSDKPTCIIAKTFMGKGISFMEDDYKWHGIPPNLEQTIEAMKELEKMNEEILNRYNDAE
jgi:transketolase